MGRIGCKRGFISYPRIHPGFPPPMNEEYIVEHLKRFDEEVNLPIALYASPPGGATHGHNSVMIETCKKAAEQIKNFQAWKVGARGNLIPSLKLIKS